MQVIFCCTGCRLIRRKTSSWENLRRVFQGSGIAYHYIYLGSSTLFYLGHLPGFLLSSVCLYYFFKIKFGLWSVADNGFSITAYQLCKPPQAGSLRRLLGVGLTLTRLLRHLRLLLLANHFFFSGKVLLLWWKQYWRSQESRTQKQKMWIFYPSGWHGSDTSPEIHLYYRHGTSPL